MIKKGENDSPLQPKITANYLEITLAELMTIGVVGTSE